MSSLNSSTKGAWRGMLTAIMLLITLSWVKLGITENIRVDHNPFPNSLGNTVFIIFSLSILLFAFNYWKLIWRTDLVKTSYKKEAYGVLILSTLMVPFLSNDVIIYLGHGYLHNHNIDVLSNTNVLAKSPWAPYIEDWKDGPFVYGPINLIPAKLANYIGGENLYFTFLSYKVLMLLTGIGVIELLSRIVKTPRDLLIAVLAPAFWLHNVGNMHNDLIACLFVLSSVYFAVNKQILPSAVFIGIAMACKVSIVLYVPFIFVLYFYTSHIKTRGKLLNILVGFILMILSIIGCYAIYWTGISSIEVPFKYLSNQQATKSFSEILGEILNVVFSGINKANIESELAMETVPTNDPKVYWWGISKTIFNILGIIMFIITGLIFVIKTKLRFTKEQVIELFIKFNFIFFFFYLHIFQAWYLILIMPLMIISANERIKKYFMVLCCYSGIHTIMITIARPSYLFYVLPVLVIINCGLFLWQFRKNYLKVES